MPLKGARIALGASGGLEGSTGVLWAERKAAGQGRGESWRGWESGILILQFINIQIVYTGKNCCF